MPSSNLFLFSFKKSLLSSLYSSYNPFINSQGCEFLPQPTDNLKTRNYKKVNMLFMNIVHNGQYENILKSNDEKRSKAYFYKNALINLKYDLPNFYKIFQQIEKIRIKYLKDNNDYNLINKRLHYRDLSIKGILRALNQKSKLKGVNCRLSDFSYKRALKNLENNKPLSQKTKMLINRFLKTIKANKGKNTLKAMNQQNRRVISVKYNHQNYRVVLKKSSRRGFIPDSITRDFNIPTLINKEFKTRLENSYLLDNLKNTIATKTTDI